MTVFGDSEMLNRTVVAASLIYVMMIGSLLCTAEAEDIEYGTLTVSPGDPETVSFGECEAGDLLLWELSVDTLSTTFHYVIQTGDGRNWWHEGQPLTSYFEVEESDVGECKLWFYVNESDDWDAIVTYHTMVTKPYVSITDPADASVLNQATVIVSGYVDYWFDEVRVSLDESEGEMADLHCQHWNSEVTLTGEGAHTIYVEGFMHRGDRTMVVHDTITVTLDTQPPSVSIQRPAELGLVRDNHVVIEWTSSDKNGIASMEMNVDGEGWIALLSSEPKYCSLSTGEHTIEIRATDTAGNQATDSVTFTVDARALSVEGPYYGLPLFGVILVVILIAAALVLRLRRERRIQKQVFESFSTERDSAGQQDDQVDL